MKPASPTSSMPPSFALFAGNDLIGRETARNNLLAAVRDACGAPTVCIFDPTTESLDSFLTRFITLSMFPEPRVFQIRHADQCSEEELTTISIYLDFEVPNTFLVIESKISDEKDKKKSKMAILINEFVSRQKKTPQRYVVEYFPLPAPYEIPAWIQKNTPRFYNRTIKAEDAALLVDLVGTDLSVIHSELQKLDIHLEPQKPICTTDIELLCGVRRETHPHELAQALGKRDLLRAFQIVERLFQRTFYAPLLISALFHHFWALWRIRLFSRQYPEEMNLFIAALKRKDQQTQNSIGRRICEAAGLLVPGQSKHIYPLLIKPDLIGQAKSFGDEQLKQIFEWLEEFDTGIKSGTIEANKISIQLLCYKILRVAELMSEKPKICLA